MNTDDKTPKTAATDTTRRTPVSTTGDAPRRPTASAYPAAGASADTTRRPTVPPALLAAAAALLVAVPESERAAFWRLVRVSLARVQWYSRLAAKMFRLAAPVDLDRALVPAREGVDLALVAVREECDARGLASVLDALFAALLGHTPDALPESIGVAGLVARADDALAVWAHAGHAHGFEVETAAPVAKPDTAPLPHDPRFALVAALVTALPSVDRDTFIDAFAAYLAALDAAVRLGENGSDAAQMTAWQMADAAADVLAPFLRSDDPAAVIEAVRAAPLGAILSSTPALLEPPAMPFVDADYLEFAGRHARRRAGLWLAVSDLGLSADRHRRHHLLHLHKFCSW